MHLHALNVEFLPLVFLASKHVSLNLRSALAVSLLCDRKQTLEELLGLYQTHASCGYVTTKADAILTSES